MKKFINVLAVVLALVMCLGVVVACSGNEGTDDKTTTAGTTTAGGKVTTTNKTTTTAEETTTEEVTTDPEADDVATPKVDVPANGTITNADELHAVLVNGAADADYVVTATELDMNNLKWDGLKDYAGTFDFGNCKIKNAAYPLFKSVKGGTVKNLVLADSKQNYTNDEAKADTNPKTGEVGNIYYSPVVCYATEITVSNVVIEASVEIYSECWTEKSCHGGIVATAEGPSILIEDCVFNGTYTTDSNNVYVAGVVGFINCSSNAGVVADDPASSTVLVTRCVNNGTIINLGFNMDSKTGGVIGALNNGTAIKCANYGKVDSSDLGQTAGVAAYVGGNTVVMDCINTAEVYGAKYVGGICGYSNGSVRYFINCINTGKVVCEKSNQHAGVVGLAKKTETLTNCYNLTSGHVDIFKNINAESVDLTNTATHQTLVISNCGNFATVDEIVAAMEAVNPGVFEKTAAGGIALKLS